MPYQSCPSTTLKELLTGIRGCTKCTSLPLGPAPLLQADPRAKILIAGQAPGRKAHQRGVPFDDLSGDRLRQWLGIGRDVFYDASCFAIAPMAFCYPGTGASGDLPPRPQCAETWRAKLLHELPNIELTIVIGQYAMDWHLTDNTGTLTDKVSDWRKYWPEILPVPHPSPRNNRWFKRNPWFTGEIVPVLQERVRQLFGD